MWFRVKDMPMRMQRVNEAQVRDASPQFQQFADSVQSVAQAIGSALGEVSSVANAADAAADAISAAKQTSQSIGVDSNAIIDNINAAGNADPSTSIVTLSDHEGGVRQAYNILGAIKTSLSNALGLCKQLNNLAARQFQL